MSEFREELVNLINRHSMENGSNTPDFILANYLMLQIESFDTTVNRREEWYGRESPKKTWSTDVLRMRIQEIVDFAIRVHDHDFNDHITREGVHDKVKQELEVIQSRGGVEDFRVVCDETNNSCDVIDQKKLRVRVNFKALGRLCYVARQALPRKGSILEPMVVEDYE